MADHDADFDFPPFRLSFRDARLYRGGTPLDLRPKTFAVLRMLVERPGTLVRKRELLDGVWPDVVVGDDVLKGCIRELRDALGDDPSRPRYVETAHRLGYRFVGAQGAAPPPPAGEAGPPFAKALAEPAAGAAAFVGREHEVARLAFGLARAAAGERSLSFVVGEPGAGKSCLLQRFVAQHGARARRVVVGHCTEQFGVGEPYLPIFEGLAALVRSEPALGAELAARVPGFAGSAHSSLGAIGPTAMVRTLADTLEWLASEGALLFVLEDLHWCDDSTLSLLSLLGARTSPAQLCVVASLRPAGRDQARPALAALVGELAVRGRADELELAPLAPRAVADYVRHALGGARVGDALAVELCARTGGSPMFLARLVDALLREGALVAHAGEALLRDEGNDAVRRLPRALRSFVAQQVARLSPVQRDVLAAACVATTPLPAEALARVLGGDALVVEDACEALTASPGLLKRSEDLWDQRRRAYAPVHSVLRDVVQDSLADERRARLHALLGGELATRSAVRGEDASHALALHFEAARDPVRAAGYLIAAALGAQRRFAPREALALVERGLALIARASLHDDVTLLELRLLLLRGQALIALSGFGSAELGESFARARKLAEHVQDDAHRAQALLGLRAYYGMRQLSVARELSDEVIAIGTRTASPQLLIEGHAAAGMAAFYTGALRDASVHYDALMAQLDAQGPAAPPVARGAAHARIALLRFVEGRPERALTECALAITEARRGGDPFERAWAHVFTAWVHYLVGQPADVVREASEGCELAERHGFRYWEASARIALGAGRGGLGERALAGELVSAGLALWRAIGAEVLAPMFVAVGCQLLAEAGQVDHARAELAAARAVAQRTGEHVFDSELMRMEATWLGQREPALAHALLRDAAVLAESQGALGLHLRVARTAFELALAGGQRRAIADARARLRASVARLGEGEHLPDLQAARALLG